jgi:hypothetical protein
MILPCLGLIISLSGCGRDQKSTLPPVSEEVKQHDAPAQPVTPDQPEAGVPEGDRPALAWVIKELINVRSQPSTSADVVAQLPRGTELNLIELADKWWKVLLTDGRTAYVYGSLISTERYVDPWTRFKFEASRADAGLKIISAVAGIDGEAPSAALTVSTDEWGSLAEPDRTKLAESAFNFWSECLNKCGYDPKKALIVFRDSSGTELGRVSLQGGKAIFLPK